MYQNSKEVRGMKKMSNVEVSSDIFDFKVQSIYINKWKSSLHNPNFLLKQREPNTAPQKKIIIKKWRGFDLESKDDWERGEEEKR